MGRKKEAKCHVGQREIVKALGLDPRVVGQVEAVVDDMVVEVKRRAPYNRAAETTGEEAPKRRLAKATRGFVVDYGGRPVGVVQVGESTKDPGFFSVFHEYGTKNMPPRPFIRPAAKAVCAKYGAHFGEWSEHREGGVQW